MRQQTNHHWFRSWLVAWSAPSHYLKQCWNIVNSNLWNKLQWNPRQNSFIFIQENAFENVVCEGASIQSRPQWVKAPKTITYEPAHLFQNLREWFIQKIQLCRWLHQLSPSLTFITVLLRLRFRPFDETACILCVLLPNAKNTWWEALFFSVDNEFYSDLFYFHLGVGDHGGRRKERTRQGGTWR